MRMPIVECRLSNLNRRLFAIRHSPFAIFLVVSLLRAGAIAWAETVNRIVAVVNDDVITDADVALHATAMLEAESQKTPSDARAMELHVVVLRRLIEQRLILQEAKRQEITVSTDEVIERLKTLRDRFDSDEAFEQSLQESGMTREQLKEQLREQLLVQKIIDRKVRAFVYISPQEVAKELTGHPEMVKHGERVRVSHLLVRMGEQRSEAAARERVDDVHRQLTAGADFAALAKQYSEDPHANEGGAMDWVAQGELMPELDAVAFGLQPGELSSPIQTRLGFHLLKVEERKPVEALSVTEANQAIYQRLYQQKFQAAFQRWLTELKKNAYIDIPVKG